MSGAGNQQPELPSAKVFVSFATFCSMPFLGFVGCDRCTLFGFVLASNFNLIVT
jgi:hypothetical protein